VTVLSWNFETTKSPAVANYARLAIKEQSIVAVTLTTFPTPSTAFSNCSAFRPIFLLLNPLLLNHPQFRSAEKLPGFLFDARDFQNFF